MQGAPFYFRYNPLTSQWVCVGPHLPVPRLEVHKSLEKGKRSLFETIQYPGNIFVVDPTAVGKRPPESLLYKEHVPVGEYHVMLYHGEKTPYEWDYKHWDEWIDVLQLRLLKLYENPYLHNLKILMPLQVESGGKTATVRVGEIVATSHPICRETSCIEHELARKLREHEHAFRLMETDRITVMAASAPEYAQEIWLLPQGEGSCLEQCHAATRKDLSRVLAKLVTTLKDEFPRHEYILEVVSSLQQKNGCSWWLRLYQDTHQHQNGIVPVMEYPEILVHRLRLVL